MNCTKIFTILNVALFWVSCTSSAQTQTSRTAKQRWLKKNVHVVDNLKPNNTNFTQFEALKKAIGDRRIVLLGEQTHGDGTTFEAKVRLIKFLHKEMGFEILAFESGFYQVFKVWSELEKGNDYRQVVPKGIHRRWAKIKQIQPVFSYVRNSIGTKKPLEMAGIDILMGGSYSKNFLVEDFESFLTKSYPNLATENDFKHAKQQLRKVLNSSAFLPSNSDQTSLLSILDIYIDHLEENLESEHQWNTDSFWAQVLRNLKTNLINNWSRLDGTYSRPVFFSRRDRIMADNIKWLSNGNKKVIVWSSVTHNMQNFDPKLLEKMKWSPDTKFMGEYLSKLIGSNNMFHLTFTGYEGFYSNVGEHPARQKFPKPSPESLESLLNQTGIKYGYFMLNTPNTPKWLKKPFKASFVFNREHLSKWGDSIDAVFFTKTMEPSSYKN